MKNQINVLAELERLSTQFEYVSDEEIKCVCPFHDDSNPSLCMNVKSGLFKCQTAGCIGKGDIVTFMARVLEIPRATVMLDLSKRYDLSTDKIINPKTIERYHQAIQTAGPLKQELYARGITDENIREHRLGCSETRITIPIYNVNGQCVNVRRYLPGAPTKKFMNTRGFGKMIRLYPIKQLQYDSIVICAGELKAIVAVSLLNPHNIGAVTTTGGEGNWDHAFTESFRDKRVWVCYDIDDGGRNESIKLCARLQTPARWVGNVSLPLDPELYPHGDLSDWVGKESASDEELYRLLDETPEWKPTTPIEETELVVESLHLSDASHSRHTNRRIKVKAVVSAVLETPFVIPKRVNVHCDRNQAGCAACPIFVQQPDKDGYVKSELSSESPAIISMISAPKKVQRDALIEGLKIPTCKCVEFIPIEFQNVEETRVSPQLEIASRAADHVLLPAYCIGTGLELNEAYEFQGRMFPHPATQEAVILSYDNKSVQDALSNYTPTTDTLVSLTSFQPEEWTLNSLSNKLNHIYDDFSANVTRIYQRQLLHLAVDLSFHSPLVIEFDGNPRVKGWTEILVLGDSAQGKSETAMNMKEHYGLGEKVECKNASVAGLLGGLQKFGTKWFVSWGIIPTQDRRLVILEELKGASPEVIAKLTDMRSSGIAEIPKIEKRRTHARTRLLALSNPRSDHPMQSYAYGIEAVRELIGSPEDIRRFDAIFIASSADIDSAVVNRLQRHRPTVEHVYTRDLCRNLVLWSWTRENVTFEQEAYEFILDEATRLSKIFVDTIPIVDRGSMRFKLARLSAALACRTFSTNDDISVTVRKCHVEYITQILEEHYSSASFGYLDYSSSILEITKLIHPDMVKSRIAQLPFAKDFIAAALRTDDIQQMDIADWTGWDYTDSREMLSFLVRKRALLREQRVYRKTPAFIELLKALQETIDDRPDYIGEVGNEF